MTSYKIYKIVEKASINTLFSSSWLENIKPIRGDLEVISQKINNLRKRVKSAEILINDVLATNAYKIKYQYNMQLPGGADVWIPEDVVLIKKEQLLFISNGKGHIRFLIEKHLGNNIDIVPKDFKTKKLIKIWTNLKKSCSENGHMIKIHRIIMNKVYLEGDLIKEMNISTNNVENLGYFKTLIQNCEQIKVLTLKIRWNISDTDGNKLKDLTVRLDSSGGMLLYGNHSKISVNNLLEILSKSFN